MPLDEGPRSKSGKLRLNLHDTCFGGKINWFGQKNSAKTRAPDLENQATTKVLSNSRIQFASNQSKLDPEPSSKLGLSNIRVSKIIELEGNGVMHKVTQLGGENGPFRHNRPSNA